jgi:hypothetical protein
VTRIPITPSIIADANTCRHATAAKPETANPSPLLLS